jgi:hypothetical protein
MPSSGSCGASTRGVIFNFGYLGTNKKQSADPDPSCRKYPIPDDTPLPFGHRKIMPRAGQRPLVEAPGGAVEVDACPSDAVNLAVLSGAPMAGVRSVSGAGKGGGFCG